MHSLKYLGPFTSRSAGLDVLINAEKERDMQGRMTFRERHCARRPMCIMR